MAHRKGLIGYPSVTGARRVLALSAAATVAAGAAFATTTAPSVEAKAGRRFCMYVNGERTKDQNTRYVVVNYKKDRKCHYDHVIKFR